MSSFQFQGGADPARAWASGRHLWAKRPNRWSYLVEQRQLGRELELAQVHGILVLRLQITAPEAVPMWEFHHTAKFLALGYAIARRAFAEQGAPGTVPTTAYAMKPKQSGEVTGPFTQ
jgi:hypothetical protein